MHQPQMPPEGYTGPAHNGDGTSLAAGAGSDSAATGTAGHRPAVVDQQVGEWNSARRVAEAVSDALTKVTAPQDGTIRLVDALRFASLAIPITDDDAPDASVQQRLTRLPEFLIRDLKRRAYQCKRWGWWKKLCPSRLVDPPAPARDQAENAGALRLRALVRQQCRRGPPREEQGDEPPALRGPHRLLGLASRRSPVAVHCPLSADRAAWKRT
jgi:hypothetical protein